MEMSQYFVLLALSEGPMHGYAVSDQIIGDSTGGIYVRPSTLYFVLKSLEDQKLIERWGSKDDTGRKIYRITNTGQRKLADTARLHDRAARLAKERLGLRY
jgi:DNA-binding PadR family transcriptional regulator